MKLLRTSRIGGLVFAFALCALAFLTGTPRTASAYPICTYSNLVYFYAEPEMVTKVGQCRSSCNSAGVCTGTITPYSKEIFRISCNFQCE